MFVSSKSTNLDICSRQNHFRDTPDFSESSAPLSEMSQFYKSEQISLSGKGRKIFQLVAIYLELWVREWYLYHFRIVMETDRDPGCPSDKQTDRALSVYKRTTNWHTCWVGKLCTQWIFITCTWQIWYLGLLSNHYFFRYFRSPFTWQRRWDDFFQNRVVTFIFCRNTVWMLRVYHWWANNNNTKWKIR